MSLKSATDLIAIAESPREFDNSPRTRAESAAALPSSGRSPRRWSLAGRMAAWFALSALALLIAIAGLLLFALQHSIFRADDEFLCDKVAIIVSEISGDPRDLRDEVTEESTTRQFAPLHIRVIDDEGRIMAESPGMTGELPLERLRDVLSAHHSNAGAIYQSDSGKSFRVLRHDWTLKSSHGTIQAALDIDSQLNLLHLYRTRVGIAVLVATAVFAFVGYWIARRGTQPVMEITAAARKTRSSTLSTRLPVEHLPAELLSLAETFNEMLARLEESFARLTRFSADVAHELRTPLNNLRGAAEVALNKTRAAPEYREVIESSVEEIEKMSRIIESLLFLARSERDGGSLQREPVSLGVELQDIHDFYQLAASEAEISLHVSCESTSESVQLNRTLFQRAVCNLIENSLRHTSRDGTVRVEAASGESDSAAALVVTVCDTGSGLSPSQLQHLFEPLFRDDASRSKKSGGAGLGLCIVKSIMNLHGGTIDVKSEAGKGTSVVLVFPQNKPARV